MSMERVQNRLLFTNYLRYSRDSNWREMFEHLLVFLESLPDRDQYEKEFCDVLSSLGTQLESEGEYGDMFNCYEQGLRYFPTSSLILNDIGMHLLRLNQPETALPYYEMAVRNNDSILSEKNVQTCKLNLLPRWHFRMLNDAIRNEAYRTAIRNVVSKEHGRVLDIGAGCGLLSFYVSECEFVEQIISIESCTVLASIAEKALGDSDQIRVVSKNSTSMSGSDFGLSNLVVTEIFDAGLFGEQALATLIHAWENLLTPSAIIVPSCADLFVSGINSHSVTSQHKVNHLQNLFVDSLCVTQDTDQPYEAENLRHIEYRIMTDTKKVVSVAFGNLQQLKSLNDENKIEFSLTASENGVIHAFAVWYDLHLDGTVRITTDPREKNVTCWEQAIIYLDHPLEVVQDQKIDLQLSCRNGRLCIELQHLVKNCAECFCVSQEMVTFLNDPKVNKVVENINLPAEFHSRLCRVLDLNPFPLFALRIAKLRGKGTYFFVAESDNDFKFVTFLWNQQGFCLDDVVLTIFRTYQELFENVPERSLDVAVINPLSSNGNFNEETFNNLENLNQMLKSDGLMLPVKVEMVIELVESECLELNNRVDDNNLLNFKVAEEINKYAILEEWQIQANLYERKTLGSGICKFTDFKANSQLISNQVAMEISAHGRANGILCWYNISFSDSLRLNTYESSHYKSYCFIFDQEKEVSPDGVCNLNFQQEYGLLKVRLDD